MKRKIYDKMLAWKDGSAGKTALLIEGARRVGKTFTALEFARIQYRSYILIDFSTAAREVRELFENYLTELDTFFENLSVYYRTVLYPRKSVIIFDEVQTAPYARAAIKQLVADGRYDYIETGTLVSISKNVKDIIIPSEERRISMYPMDYEEFLWALDDDTLMPLIENCFIEKKPLGQVLHRRSMDQFRRFMIVGGMPQAVAEYIPEKSFAKADIAKRHILGLYRDEITKQAAGYEQKVKSIFDGIPAALMRSEKRFMLSSLKHEARFRDYESAFFWLEDAGFVNYCYNAAEPETGLKTNPERTALKCFMADTGLLISHAFNEDSIIKEDIYRRLLFSKIEINNGMITENAVAQLFAAAGHELYYYSNNVRNDRMSRMEIDFLIPNNNSEDKYTVSPVEVKSGKMYSLVSMSKFREKYSAITYTPYVLSPGDLKEDNGIVFLPLYMAGLL